MLPRWSIKRNVPSDDSENKNSQRSTSTKVEGTDIKNENKSDDGNRQKKIEGIFRTAFAHSISKNVVERIADDEDSTIATAASNMLATYMINAGNENGTENGTENALESAASEKIETKGGTVHNLLLSLIQSQRTWYLTGKTDGEVPPSPIMIAPAHPQFVQIASTFIPSPTVFKALHPTAIWVPEIAKKTIATSIASALPLAQPSINEIMKENMEWILMEEEWRAWVKDSTTGFIEQQGTPDATSS